jgi:hypothetical protein
MESHVLSDDADFAAFSAKSQQGRQQLASICAPLAPPWPAWIKKQLSNAKEIRPLGFNNTRLRTQANLDWLLHTLNLGNQWQLLGKRPPTQASHIEQGVHALVMGAKASEKRCRTTLIFHSIDSTSSLEALREATGVTLFDSVTVYSRIGLSHSGSDALRFHTLAFTCKASRVFVVLSVGNRRVAVEEARSSDHADEWFIESKEIWPMDALPFAQWGLEVIALDCKEAEATLSVIMRYSHIWFCAELRRLIVSTELRISQDGLPFVGCRHGSCAGGAPWQAFKTWVPWEDKCVRMPPSPVSHFVFELPHRPMENFLLTYNSQEPMSELHKAIATGDLDVVEAILRRSEH